MNRTLLLIAGLGALLLFALFYTVYYFEDSEPWGERVAVVRVVGVISGDGYSSNVNPHDIGKLIEEAEDNPSVKAIVIEIDSPGGAPVASDEIARYVEDAKKPVVTWISDVGASGGYWVAASGDYVMAHPSSLTGSIGAYSLIFSFEELMNEWGISAELVSSGKNKGIGLPISNLTDEQKEILQEMIDEIHIQFVEHVADAREMEIDEVKLIADGRPLSGRQALELGLIDALGNRKDAISKAGELGGIEKEDPEIIILEVQAPLFSSIFSKASENIGYGIGAGLKSGVVKIQ